MLLGIFFYFCCPLAQAAVGGIVQLHSFRSPNGVRHGWSNSDDYSLKQR